MKNIILFIFLTLSINCFAQLTDEKRENIEKSFSKMLNDCNNDTKCGKDWARSIMKEYNNDTASLKYLIKLGEDYLYNPFSEYHNDEIYITMLRRFINNDSINDIDKLRPQRLLFKANQNRINTTAYIFDFNSIDENRHSLNDFNTEYILLYFYDPECEDCIKLKNKLSKSGLIKDLIEQNNLTIIAFYPEESKEKWLNSKSFIPETWINAWSESSVSITDSYLKEIPTLYLLNKDKTILLKEISIKTLFQYLKGDNKSYQ